MESERRGPLGRTRNRWKDSFKMSFRKFGSYYVGWMQFSFDRFSEPMVTVPNGAQSGVRARLCREDIRVAVVLGLLTVVIVLCVPALCSLMDGYERFGGP
jgi:hypothetical protein